MNTKRKKWKYGMLAMVITILGIFLVIISNIVVERITEYFDLTMDLTADKRYAISVDTKEYIRNLKNPVKITVLVDEEKMAQGSYYIIQAYENLLEYERNSSKIELEFVDLIDNPTYVSKYQGLELNSYDIIIEQGERKEVLSFSEMYEYDDTGTSIVSSKVEQLVTNAIVAVTTKERPKIAILTGYDKIKPEDLGKLLETNHYEIQEQSLLTGEIDRQAEAAILYAPQSDLTEESIGYLERWLENDGEQGKNLYVFLDPIVTETPNLNAFLEKWGLVAERGYAFESDRNLYYDKFYYPIAQYADKKYADGMTNRDMTIMALCRPVDVLFEEKNNYKTSVLLNFSKTSGVAELGDTNIDKKQITGNVNGMVMSTHSWYGENVTTSNVILSGSALAFSGSLVSQSTFANAEYILGLFKTLMDDGKVLNIVPKDLSIPTHTMTGAQMNKCVWGFMVILPIIVIIVAIVVWRRRRHR